MTTTLPCVRCDCVLEVPVPREDIAHCRECAEEKLRLRGHESVAKSISNGDLEELLDIEIYPRADATGD